ncbi:MAG: hypothetical protein NVS3B10_21740 [Polyangiales bacterium]
MLLGFALVTTLACGKKETPRETDPPSAPSAQAGGAQPLHATLEGKAVDFAFGRAFARFGGLHVVLSSVPTSCGAVGPVDGTTLELDLPPGPKGNFFAGATIGVEVWLHDARTAFVQGRAAPWQSALTLDETAGSGRIAGSLDFATRYVESAVDGGKRAFVSEGRGRFSAEICDREALPAKVVAAPDESPDAPLAGTLGGAPFRARSAIATVFTDVASGQRYVESLSFHDAEVDCATHFAHAQTERTVVLKDLGGMGGPHMLPGPPPADAFVSAPQKDATGKSAPVSHALGRAHRAWARLDPIELAKAKSGDVVNGAAFATADDDTKPSEAGTIAGTFSAKICL